MAIQERFVCNITEAKNVVEMLTHVPQVVTPHIEGNPGVGKSDIVRQIAYARYALYATGEGCTGCKAKGGPSARPGDHVVGCGGHHDARWCKICSEGATAAHIRLTDVRLSNFDPIELKGLPYPEDGITKWGCPEFLPTNQEEYSILFLDEFANAPSAVQNAALQLIYDRRLNQNVLSKRCALVCASNDEDSAAYITRLGGPAQNRLAHIQARTDVGAWVEWAKENNIRQEIIFAVELDEGRVLLPPKWVKSQPAQPTPRTWEFVSRLWEQQKVVKDRDIRKICLPIIGPPATVEFLAFLAQYQAVTPERVVMHGEMPTFDTDEVSARFASVCAVANWIDRHAKTLLNEKCLDNIFKFVKLFSPELQTKFVKEMQLRKKENTPLLVYMAQKMPPEFKKILMRVMDVLKD